MSGRMQAYVATALLAMTIGCGRYGFEVAGSSENFVDCGSALATDHCYAVSVIPADWHTAHAACQSDLGPTAHLVTIDGPEENAWASQLAESLPRDPDENNPNQRKRMWMGGNELDEVGVWTWITGEAFAYQNWREGEPSGPGEERCLIMLGEFEGLWDDRPCEREYEYLCERE